MKSDEKARKRMTIIRRRPCISSEIRRNAYVDHKKHSLSTTMRREAYKARCKLKHGSKEKSITENSQKSDKGVQGCNRTTKKRRLRSESINVDDILYTPKSKRKRVSK